MVPGWVVNGRAWCVRRVPLITQFYGAFQDAYQIFLVMEYCSGGDLLERLKQENRAMSERRVILEVAVAAAAHAAAHARPLHHPQVGAAPVRPEAF